MGLARHLFAERAADRCGFRVVLGTFAGIAHERRAAQCGASASLVAVRAAALCRGGLRHRGAGAVLLRGFFLMPLYLGELRAQGSATTGWLLLPSTALMALVSALAGRGFDRIGCGRAMMVGFIALLVSALMQATFNAGTPWPWVLAAFACTGLGWGCVLGPSMAAALAALPQALAGTALGAATTLHNIGGALGLAIGTEVFRLAAQDGGFVAGYQLVMLLLAAVCLGALAMLLRWRNAL